MSPSVSTLLAPRPDVTTDIAARAVDATKIYGRGDTTVQALDDVSVEFPRGRFTAIMGPSGSGKSTLMHCVAGLDTPHRRPGLHRRRRPQRRSTRSSSPCSAATSIGFIFQAFNLVPTLTARREHHAADGPRRPQARPGLARHRRSAPSASATGSRHRPSELSGGQQQRVAVRPGPGQPAARSSSPTSPPATSTRAPAPRSSRSCARPCDELGQTIVMVTHDPVAAGLRRPGALPGRRPASSTS